MQLNRKFLYNLKLRFHVTGKDIRQSVKPSLAGKTDCRMTGCLFPCSPFIPPASLFVNWEVQLISRHIFHFLCKNYLPSPGTAIRFCFGTEEQPFAIAGHVKRADKRINGLTERNMGTVVLFLYLFVSLPVCRMRFAGQQKRMHGNGA